MKGIINPRLKYSIIFTVGAVSVYFVANASFEVVTDLDNAVQVIERIIVTDNGIASGDKILDINTGGNVISYGPLLDGGLNPYITGYEETDPIFSQSPAYVITNNDIINWGDAYSRGDHHLMGYLTGEVDPIFVTGAQGQRCYFSGSHIRCNQSAPTGSGYRALSGVDAIHNTNAGDVIIGASLSGYTSLQQPRFMVDAGFNAGDSGIADIWFKSRHSSKASDAKIFVISDKDQNNIFSVRADGRTTIGYYSGSEPTNFLTIGGNALIGGNGTFSGSVQATQFIATMSGTGSYKYNTTLDMTVPDYVFDKYFNVDDVTNPTYTFLPLSEVQAFITTNKHLPRVPSRAEITKDGVINIQGLMMTILEKVEESYLYLFGINDKVDAQQKRIDQQQKEIQALAAEVEVLKNK